MTHLPRLPAWTVTAPRALQLHAEQHEVTWSLLQTTLTLAIPAEATPLFVTSAGVVLCLFRGSAAGRLAFVV